MWTGVVDCGGPVAEANGAVRKRERRVPSSSVRRKTKAMIPMIVPIPDMEIVLTVREDHATTTHEGSGRSRYVRDADHGRLK